MGGAGCVGACRLAFSEVLSWVVPEKKKAMTRRRRWASAFRGGVQWGRSLRFSLLPWVTVASAT
eukprot:13722181-Alexandrium_andersonii.AAC.1